MGLKEEINKLVKLQKIDSQVYVLTQKMEAEKPARLDEIKYDFNNKKQQLTEFEEKVKRLQLEKKDKELDLASKEEGVQKAQGQLYQLKTNKEYQTKMSEISSLKADVSVLEEDILKTIERLEEAEKSLNDAQNSLTEEEKKFKQEEEIIRKEISEIEVEINTLKDKRSIFTNDIDKNILGVYERLLTTCHGLAMAPVKNENCGACYMLVSHQKINEVKMYKELVYCESCLRILYIPEEVN